MPFNSTFINMPKIVFSDVQPPIKEGTLWITPINEIYLCQDGEYRRVLSNDLIRRLIDEGV